MKILPGTAGGGLSRTERSRPRRSECSELRRRPQTLAICGNWAIFRARPIPALLYLTLLGAALLGNVFVFGQGRKPDSLHFSRPGLEFGQTLPGYIKPPMVFKLSPGKPYAGKSHKSELSVYIGDSVRIMSPDWNLEPMPNGRIRKP